MTAQEMQAKLDKIAEIVQQQMTEIEAATPGPSAYQIGYHDAMKKALDLLKLAGGW